ncbi:hypothetical protein D1AOALGA4SA_7888 [Olavius algarvensis Delta 1 endosymbiont]|nr:hypothetical protein D1AOALGA4SA_7888 [Olavius algarvensis Delta 1 endosymbiont]
MAQCIDIKAIKDACFPFGSMASTFSLMSVVSHPECIAWCLPINRIINNSVYYINSRIVELSTIV